MFTAKEFKLMEDLQLLSEKESSNSFTRLFKKHGYQKIGQGVYGVVYAKKGSNRVIKLVKNIWNVGYLSYARYAMKNHTQNRFLPKIYNIIKLDFISILFMEKLVQSDTLTLKSEKMTNTINNHYISNNLGRPKIKKVKSLSKIVLLGNRIIKKENDHHDASWDLHQGNVMFRKQNNRYQSVITDPIAG